MSSDSNVDPVGPWSEPTQTLSQAVKDALEFEQFLGVALAQHQQPCAVDSVLLELLTQSVRLKALPLGWLLVLLFLGLLLLFHIEPLKYTRIVPTRCVRNLIFVCTNSFLHLVVHDPLAAHIELDDGGSKRPIVMCLRRQQRLALDTVVLG